jgi:hypothetical protein
MVSWRVVVTLSSGRIVSGEIYDCTEKGAFLHTEEDLLNSVETDDTIGIKGKIKNIPFSFKATVRWKGKSDRHACSGFGVEFPEKHQVFAMVTQPPSIVPWEDFSH